MLRNITLDTTYSKTSQFCPEKIILISALSCFIFQGLELKGQMVFCPESDSILFVGSPFLDGLDGLTGRGLFISDIPLHDATRDVILVGEQARAQVSYESCFIIYGCYIIRL